MEKTTITFYPVGCGDCILLELENGPKMMWDCNFRKSTESEEQEDVYDVLNNLLSEKLITRKNGLPFLDAFVLTHADQDHCRGFAEKFYLGDPDKISSKDKDEKKILIGELWYSPRVVIEDEMCDDAIAFKKEAERRMELFKKDSKAADKDGNRIRIIGWVKEDKLEGLEERITTPRDEICNVNGKKYNNFRMFIHAPFKDSILEANRNETSIVMQIRIDCEGQTDVGKIVLAGDCEWPVWETIVENSIDKTLSWSIFEAPHHCSWSYFGPDRESGEVKDASLTFLGKKEVGAVIVASSKFITSKGNPPCEKAKNRYVEKVGESNFFCTGGNKKEDKQAPVVFELQGNGFHRSLRKTNNGGSELASKQPHVYG